MYPLLMPQASAIAGGILLTAGFTLFVVPVLYKLFARGTGTPDAVSHELGSLQARDSA
jgi:hypothetical protein